METYFGCVRTPADAIKLFEACRLGLLPRVQRRLSEKERQSIKSGSVFVWDEREAGMRRWTDGKSWSASRVSGSFLTYREMEGKRGGGCGTTRRTTTRTPEGGRASDEDQEGEPECYRYKTDGLTKQSFSITTSQGQHLHLISYYSRTLPGEREPPQPTTDPSLRHITPAKGMYPESSLQESAPPALTRAPMQSYNGPQRQQDVYAAWQWAAAPLPPSPNRTPPPHWVNGKHDTEQSSQAYLPAHPHRAPHYPPPPSNPHYERLPQPGVYRLGANEHAGPSQSQQLQAQAAQAVRVGHPSDIGHHPQVPLPAMATTSGGFITPPRTKSLSPTQPSSSDAYPYDSYRRGSTPNILLHPNLSNSKPGSVQPVINSGPHGPAKDSAHAMSELALRSLDRKFHI